jgi:DNA-binding LytR/AlgR family response regulator
MDLNQVIPSYLVSKKNNIRLVLFTAGFALLFINLYSPFDVRNWFGLDLKSQELFFYSSLIILTGVLVAVVSRVLLYYFNRRKVRTKLWAFLLIMGLEIFFMALFYTIYESVFIKGDHRTYVEVFRISVQNTALVLLLPYAVLWLYFSWQDKNNKIKQLTNPDESWEVDSKVMVPFFDEKGTMRISIKLVDILYIQATDNYVTIYYKKNNEVTKFLLRNTIKNLEKSFEKQPITRCHRSYMVNFNEISVIRKVRGGHVLEIGTDPMIEVPVSKMYLEDVFQLFGKA